jgi:hypothetical protein
MTESGRDGYVLDSAGRVVSCAVGTRSTNTYTGAGVGVVVSVLRIRTGLVRQSVPRSRSIRSIRAGLWQMLGGEGDYVPQLSATRSPRTAHLSEGPVGNFIRFRRFVTQSHRVCIRGSLPIGTTIECWGPRWLISSSRSSIHPPTATAGIRVLD